MMPRKQKVVETVETVETPVVPGVNPVPDEIWSVAQVASHMGLSYQTARNQMLSGVFGQSHYDPAKRRLTVSANRVKTVKTMKTKKRTKKRRRTA